MPNWCFNNLRVAGPKKIVARFQNNAARLSAAQTPQVNQAPEVFSFQSLVPIPANLLTSEPASGRHEWEFQNWGCRGGANEAVLVSVSQDALAYEFETAWTPPLAFLEHLSRAWPTLSFELEYDEPYAGLKGNARAKAGVLKDYRSDF